MTMQFARTLARLRREQGLSQEQLAQEMEVSRQAVGKWEAGQSMPELDKLIVLADRFGVSLDALVRGDAPHPRPNAGGAGVGAGGEGAGSCGPAVLLVTPGYEYKSPRSWRGLPLVHINLGYGRTGPRRARGVIAIGNVATGLLAIGGFSMGIVSLGGIGLGLLSLGGIALGGAAVGGCAAGILAIGGCALGVYALGAAAVGWQAAVGSAALSPNASAGLNPDAEFLITAKTSMAQLAAYLQRRCPGMPRALVLLFSLFGL